jgi:hypothetical protein
VLGAGSRGDSEVSGAADCYQRECSDDRMICDQSVSFRFCVVDVVQPAKWEELRDAMQQWS